MPKRKRKQTRRKKVITFDADARRDYLKGFSARKRQRRAYGLAMQKCKDRKQKLEDRKETRKAEAEQIEEAERLKQENQQHEMSDAETNTSDDEKEGSEVRSNSNEDGTIAQSTVTYQDNNTKNRFGGTVIVTTSLKPPSFQEDDSEDDQVQQEKHHHSIDKQQLYAGNVNKFLHQLKGHMPSKKKYKQQQQHKHHKGRHGAATMKGMGGAADVKVARKALTKMQAKQGKNNHAARAKHKKR